MMAGYSPSGLRKINILPHLSWPPWRSYWCFTANQPQNAVWRMMNSLTAELADVFLEDSENDVTFHGFSDTELKDEQNCSFGDEAQPDIFPKEEETTSKASATSTVKPFRLRVALRSAPSTQQSTDDEDSEAEERTTHKKGVKRTGQRNRTKEERHVKFEDGEAAAALPASTEDRGSDSADDASDTFLARREQNIKANKAMLAQLMADLQKMPGGAGLLKKQAGKQKAKDRSSHPPRSAATGGESRRNPERASRRLTRSMSGTEDPLAAEEAEVELSLEEELLEVRQAPRRRGVPRGNRSKPHVIRPVEAITEDDLELVADNMTEKVYNSVTGSTCHQCRQKTVDTKTCCRSEDCRGIQGQFCGPCLRNRYGEDVKKALLDPDWKCPPCRGICNCSFCRQREGRCPTGILFPLAQHHGFSDVHSYLTSLRNKLKTEVDDVEM
ncbi:cell division cycle-associated protein 7-like isoform X1 [Simochromis diagramma]|uniref:cell division cycle-associated protein 7-like isoform X1 n=2 Tax=Simochromis diagramma TaxID=43689 RepID=UPI001A7F033E|nr:cell division cycle-associated protein 7-like isoform X1 [Simochromis diagramma]